VAEPMNATLTAPTGSPFSMLMGQPSLESDVESADWHNGILYWRIRFHAGTLCAGVFSHAAPS
jgi:hypothetical protein